MPAVAGPRAGWLMVSRLGAALVLIGLILMVVFLVTSTAGEGSLRLLLAGAGVSAVGLLLRRRRPEPDDAGRFQTLRRLLNDEQEPED